MEEPEWFCGWESWGPERSRDSRLQWAAYLVLSRVLGTEKVVHEYVWNGWICVVKYLACGHREWMVIEDLDPVLPTPFWGCYLFPSLRSGELSVLVHRAIMRIKWACEAFGTVLQCAVKKCQPLLSHLATEVGMAVQVVLMLKRRKSRLNVSFRQFI